MIEKAQQEDGYLIIYFTVVDKEGRFKNLRDMHEMCKSSSYLHKSIFRPAQEGGGRYWGYRVDYKAR